MDWDDLDPFADLPDPSVYSDPNDAYISSRPLPGTSMGADLGGVPSVDPALVKRNVQACYDLYASLSVLAVMPSVTDVIATITAERRPYVSEHLGGRWRGWLVLSRNGRDSRGTSPTARGARERGCLGRNVPIPGVEGQGGRAADPLTARVRERGCKAWQGTS